MIFIKVGKCCSDEQCGLRLRQKLVSRQNQDVCSQSIFTEIQHR